MSARKPLITHSANLSSSSFDVCKHIIDCHPSIASVQVISHSVGVNWRWKYQSPQDKSKYLCECFENNCPPLKKYHFDRSDFLSLDLSQITISLDEHEVLSFVSKVRLYDGNYMHLPMMNYHMEDDVTLKYVEEATNYICGNREGFILSTGRYFHYYGNFLIASHIWQKFMAAFMLPCVIVSPGYMGHRLIDGYATLRLTTDSKYKSFLPTVIQLIRGKSDGLIDKWEKSC